MATTIVMPQLGYDMHEGTVVRWRKKEGETIERGEVLTFHLIDTHDNRLSGARSVNTLSDVHAELFRISKLTIVYNQYSFHGDDHTFLKHIIPEAI